MALYLRTPFAWSTPKDISIGRNSQGPSGSMSLLECHSTHWSMRRSKQTESQSINLHQEGVEPEQRHFVTCRDHAYDLMPAVHPFLFFFSSFPLTISPTHPPVYRHLTPLLFTSLLIRTTPMSDKNEQHTYDLRDSTVAATEASVHHPSASSVHHPSASSVHHPSASSDHSAHKQIPHSQQGHAHGYGHGHVASHASTHTPAVHAQLATGGEVNLEHPVHPEGEHHTEHSHGHKN